MTFLRSVLYFIYFITVSVVMHVLALPTLILPRRAIVWTSQTWSRLMLWGLKHIVGLSYEVRGTVPQSGVLVAAKHMSMWDTMALYMLIDDVCIVVKQELMKIPFYGWYIAKADVIGVDRSGAASALRQMAAKAKRVLADGRAIGIFPEGTRQKPGAAPAYKPGVAGLYAQLGVPCVPVALNSGQFWIGFLKHPGCIVIEFLPAIPAGLKRSEFMRTLEDSIETATARLVVEGRKLLKENV